MQRIGGRIAEPERGVGDSSGLHQQGGCWGLEGVTDRDVHLGKVGVAETRRCVVDPRWGTETEVCRGQEVIVYRKGCRGPEWVTETGRCVWDRRECYRDRKSCRGLEGVTEIWEGYRGPEGVTGTGRGVWLQRQGEVQWTAGAYRDRAGCRGSEWVKETGVDVGDWRGLERQGGVQGPEGVS